jgi:L-malate glycosyltransferase
VDDLQVKPEMNILLLTHSYPDKSSKWRGVFIQEQVRALSRSNKIIVVYFRTDYSHFSPFGKYSFTKTEEGNTTIYEVVTARSLPVINQLKYLAGTYRFIKKEVLKNRKIDLIHSHLSYPAGFLGTIIQNRNKIPNIITEHSWIWRYFRSRVHKICVRYALANSSGIVAVSKALSDNISEYCKRDIAIIPNVINVESFPLAQPVRGTKLNIGILGGMGNYRKGFDILLKAVAKVRNVELMVHIGGAGIHFDEFRRLSTELGIEDKCRFYGEILPEKITEFYSGLDLYILASRDETFGVVVVEAMACGLPVIATRCGGPEEILTPETGILVEKEDPEDLARAIVNMAGNLDAFNRESIRKYALEIYGPDAFISKMNRFYNKILTG